MIAAAGTRARGPSGNVIAVMPGGDPADLSWELPMRRATLKRFRARLCLALTCALWATAEAGAGTTVITHGFAPVATTPPGWTLDLAVAILAEAGDASDCGNATPPDPVGTVFTYDPDDGAWDLHCGSATPNGEIVLVFNWTEESDGLSVGGTQGYTEAAGDALYAALRDPSFPAAFAALDPLAGDVHFIGHSRGAVVNSDCVERLAAAGIPIDQVTTLDAHPVDGTLDYPLNSVDWGDNTPRVWSNVDFADNYWRADGGGVPYASDFDGISLPADVDLDLGDNIEGPLDVDPVFEHTEVHAWYYGTVDLLADDDNDGTAIDDELFTDWYGSAGTPDRDLTGFYYSALVGGTRPAPVPGTAPTWSVFEIVNGSFEVVETSGPSEGVGYSGWLYHGGAKAGVLDPWSDASPAAGESYYATLQGNGDDRALTHNRLYVDDAATQLGLLRRVATSSANDTLKITFADAGGDHGIANAPLTATTAWETVSFAIPPAQRGQTYTVRLEIDGGGDGVEAVVDLDDLHFVPEPGAALQLAAGVAFLALVRRRRAQPVGPKDSLWMRSAGTPRASRSARSCAMNGAGPHR